MQIPDYILKVLNILNQNGYEGYLVGGCVRDAIMGKPCHDFDLTTNALPDEMLRIFSGMKIIETGLKHGTVTVVSDGENVEITTYRIDGKYTDNRHPETVMFTKNIHEDLSRRDFTVNAIAYSPYDGVVDIFSGRCDIEKKLIRCVGCPDERFNEDGLRIIRALRFASVLSFDIDAPTAKSIHKNKELLKNISGERIYSELKKLLSGNNVSRILREYSDVFCVIFPELEKLKEDFTRNADCADNLRSDTISAFCAMFHGLGRDDIKKCLRVLKPDNYLKDNVLLLSDYAKCEILCDEVSVRYIMNALSNENIIRLANIKKTLFPEFDRSAFIAQHKFQLENSACVKLSDLALGGTDVMQAGIPRGPEVGRVMNMLLSAVIEGKCQNTKNELLDYLKNEEKKKGC